MDDRNRRTLDDTLANAECYVATSRGMVARAGRAAEETRRARERTVDLVRASMRRLGRPDTPRVDCRVRPV